MPALTGIYNGMSYTCDNNSLLSWVFFCPKNRKGGIKKCNDQPIPANIKKGTEETLMKAKETKETDQSNTEQTAAISMEFTEEELETLSSGILSLIEKTMQARALIPDMRVHMMLDQYYTELQALNNKVCRCM